MTFELAGPAHMIHILVLTENEPPLGTSGVLVVVTTVTYFSKSILIVSSFSSHLADLGPTGPLSGLMYEIFRASCLGFSVDGYQSEI